MYACLEKFWVLGVASGAGCTLTFGSREGRCFEHGLQFGSGVAGSNQTTNVAGDSFGWLGQSISGTMQERSLHGFDKSVRRCGATPQLISPATAAMATVTGGTRLVGQRLERC